MFPARKSAFSLIELLVVMAILALLAALLFPVFAQAREKTRAAMCTSNLRQLTMAIQEYMQDWDGGIPEFFAMGRSAEQDLSFRWYGHLIPYLKNQEILHCPADSLHDSERAVPTSLSNNPAIRSLLRNWSAYPAMPRLSYGLNFWLQQTPETTVRLPAETVLLGDCAAFQCADAVRVVGRRATSCFAYANGTQLVDILSPLTGLPGQERHSGGSNIAFFDGHVKFIPSAQFREWRQGRNCFESPLLDPRCQPWP